MDQPWETRTDRRGDLSHVVFPNGTIASTGDWHLAGFITVAALELWDEHLEQAA